MTKAKTQPKIHRDRLRELESLSLQHGAHGTRESGMCMMEAAAYVAGREHTDHPPGVSPVLGAFGRAWNDALPTDADRDRLLKPLIPDLVGTATTPEDEGTRAWMATDWLVRVHAPAWLRLAGLTKQAEQLESLPDLNAQTTPPILTALRAIRNDASAVSSAARSAVSAVSSAAVLAAESAAASAVSAVSAVSSAAVLAAESAAESAVSSAAASAVLAVSSAATASAAWSATASAAWSAASAAWSAAEAARSAAEEKLAPVVAKLQASAQDLMRRMAAVGRVQPVEV